MNFKASPSQIGRAKKLILLFAALNIAISQQWRLFVDFKTGKTSLFLFCLQRQSRFAKTYAFQRIPYFSHANKQI
jgi:hypothetical protein